MESQVENDNPLRGDLLLNNPSINPPNIDSDNAEYNINLPTFSSLLNDDSASIEPIEAVLKFRKLSASAYSPVRVSKEDPGFALFSACNYLIAPHGKLWVKFDLQIEIPERYFGQIIGRPSRSLIYSMVIGDTMLTHKEKSNLGVVIFNLSRNSLIISKGERVGTLILHKIPSIKVEELFY